MVWVYFILLFFLACLAVFLWKSGELLVHSDSIGHARWAVVLAGEDRGMERTETAFDLFREGRFDSLILSGPRVFKSHHESEFSRELLIAKGFPRDRIFQLPHEASSTLEEAAVIIHQSRLLGIDTLLIITSNYHSARARRIFQKLAGGNPETRVLTAEFCFDPKSWWAFRGTRVIWITEWLKTLNTAWEMRGDKLLTSVASNGVMLLEPNPRVSNHNPLVTLPLDSISATLPDTGAVPLSHGSRR